MAVGSVGMVTAGVVEEVEGEEEEARGAGFDELSPLLWIWR